MKKKGKSNKALRYEKDRRRLRRAEKRGEAQFDIMLGKVCRREYGGGKAKV